MGRVTESADKQHQHRPDRTPALVENRGDERGGHGREADGEREHDEAEQRERSTSASARRAASRRAKEGKRTSPICSPIWIAGTSARLYARLYMPVGPGPKKRDTKRLSQRRAANAQSAPSATGAPKARSSRVWRSVRRQGSSQSRRDTLAANAAETESRARHVSPDDGRASPTERREPDRHDGVCNVPAVRA